ncbi:hypothetical protein U1Q18_030414 [Sarracenia purpurea var. burkii]
MLGFENNQKGEVSTPRPATMNSSGNKSEHDRRKETATTPTSLDSRFNQTLRNVQDFPGKVLLTRRSDPQSDSSLRSPDIDRSFSDKDAGTSERLNDSVEDDIDSYSNPNINSTTNKSSSSTSSIENTSREPQKSTMGARATDSARLMKFTTVLSGKYDKLKIRCSFG